jgi:hypothetical protein
MEKYKKPIAIFLLIATAWHLLIVLNEKVKLSGLFQSKPESGYTWEGTTSTGSRFFWMNTDVKWQKDTPHEEFKAVTTADEGIWNPLPGYKFIDKSKGLETKWSEGLLHPDFQAFSDHAEGMWQPATGYKFLYEGDTFTESIWDPNVRYDAVKVISLQEKDNFKPFPGYQFLDKANSLSVIWMPGTVNYENPSLIAGAKEGTWDVNYKPYRPTYNRGLDYRKVLVGIVALKALGY